MHVLGFGGLLGSGKDALADVLVERYIWEKRGMSDPLWDALQALDPIIETVPLMGGEVDLIRLSEVTPHEDYVSIKAKYPEVRALLQRLGTEVGRNIIDENVWTDIAKKRIVASGRPCILTGVRFPNELRAIADLNGVSVYVVRAGVDSTGSHASETSLSADDFDVIVRNDGTLEDLGAVADLLMEDLETRTVLPSEYIASTQERVW